STCAPGRGAVLADAPSDVFEAPRLRRDAQLHLALAGSDVLFGIEGGEVAPDDLGRAIALDALRAGVPGRDVAVGIEHEDGVVADAVDELAHAQLGLAQRLLFARLLLCFQSIGDVTREAARMRELLVLRSYVRVDQHVPDRSVLADEPR